MKNILILMLLLLTIISCHKQDKNVLATAHITDSIALKLNRDAIRHMHKISAVNNDSINNLIYDSSLTLLNHAIEIDSLFLTAYINKAQVLQRKKLYNEALEVLSKVQKIRPEMAEIIMGQGFILEKIGKPQLAEEKYKQSLRSYEKRLESDGTNEVNTKSDIAFLYIFLEDKNKAINEIQNLILENPSNEVLKGKEEIIRNFDRAKFIKEY